MDEFRVDTLLVFTDVAVVAEMVYGWNLLTGQWVVE